MMPSRIVFLGGSSVAGVGDAKGGGFAGRLKKWHESLHFGNILYNLGISGNTTTEILARLTSEASIRKPNLILLTTGLNDIYRTGGPKAPTKTPLDVFCANIQKIIQVTTSMTDLIFLSAYPINESKTAPLTYWNKNIYYFMKDTVEYQRHFKNIAESAKIPYCDVFNEWLKADYQQWLSEDGLHANRSGHTKIFESLQQFLIQHFGIS